MLASTRTLLEAAQTGGYAIGGFNVYNLEGVVAVIAAAEAQRSPALLQIHPAALTHGGAALVGACLGAARAARVPIAVHLDHCSAAETIRASLDTGVQSIMADGSQLTYAQNVAFVAEMRALAQGYGAATEGELGRLSGTEDGLTVAEYEAKLTDPAQAAEFVAQTGVDALAICIGNVHGHYLREPALDFARLDAIRATVRTPLVLHGASGLPAALVQEAIARGVCKFNVNTEVREAYLHALATRFGEAQSFDLVDVMQSAVAAMQQVVLDKIALFGSMSRA